MTQTRNSELADRAMQALRALGERAEAGDLDAFRALAEVEQDVRSSLLYAVIDGLRAQTVPTSWTTIGDALGVSRQAAQQRYGDG